MINNVYKDEFKTFLLRKKAYKVFCKNIRKARNKKEKVTLDEAFDIYIQHDQELLVILVLDLCGVIGK